MFWKEDETMNAESFEKVICKGRIAVPGCVTGKVRVINNPDDIVSLLEEEIIVVRMTDPDSVPRIQRAKGVITDHGGILCHAAIVCREINKPCIVGTKVATQVLKTGDLVTMDSEGNVVRIKEV